jgi:hypothetical protein
MFAAHMQLDGGRGLILLARLFIFSVYLLLFLRAPSLVPRKYISGGEVHLRRTEAIVMTRLQ